MIAHGKKLDRDSLIAHFEQSAVQDAAHLGLDQTTPEIPYEEIYPPEMLVDVPPEDLPNITEARPKPVIAGKKPRVLLRRTPVSSVEPTPNNKKPRVLLRWTPMSSGEPFKAAPKTTTPPPRKRPSPPAKAEVPADPIARLQEWVSLARYGDPEAVEAIRKELDANPVLWQSVGDLAGHAESLLITMIADGNSLVEQSMTREVERLKAELTEGVTPSPLERLTIQRIVACWLHCQYVDRATLAADAVGAKAGSWANRQEAAEKRFQLAIKSLELVRRLKPTKALARATADAASQMEDQAKTKVPSKKTATSNGKSKKSGHKCSSGRNTEPVSRMRKSIRKASLAVQ